MSPANDAGLAADLLALLADGAVRSTGMLLAALGLEWLLRHRAAALRHRVLSAGLLALPLVSTAHVLHGEPGRLGGQGLETALAAVYLTGVALVLLPLFRGLLALRRLSSSATPATWLRHLETPGTRPTSVPSSRPAVLVAPVAVPMTFGWWRPVILFPAAASSWSPRERQTAWTHELGHIRRHDWPLLLASHLVLALFWFQPLVWLTRRRMLCLAERAADDFVLSEGTRPSEYAAHLLRRGRELQRAVCPAAMTLLQPQSLETRIRALLSHATPHSPDPTMNSLSLIALSLLVLPLSAATVVPPPAEETGCHPVEQERTPPPMDRHTLSTLKGAGLAMRFLAQDLEHSSVPRRQSHHRAARFVISNCPYRRAGVQTLATLLLELERLEIEQQPPALRADARELFQRLAALQEVAGQHWGYLEQLGIGALPLPTDGDHLHRHADLAALQDLQSLRAVADPIAATRRSLDGITPLLQKLDDPTGYRLQDARAVLEHDDGEFMLQATFEAYRAELVAIHEAASELDDGDFADRVLGLSARLDPLFSAFSGLGC